MSAGASPSMVIRIAGNLAELRANLAEGKSQIETTTAAMTKLATSFSGERLIQQANNVVAAVAQIGGVSKLTAAEQERVNSVLERALEKYAVLGDKVPAGMRELAAATKRVEESSEQALTPVEQLSFKFGQLVGGYLTAQAIWHGAEMAFRSVTEFIGSSIQSYAAAESAQTKLTAALRQHSLATPQVIGQYNDLATAFQNTTTNADEQITAMEALLTQVGGVMPSQMKAALQASADLSAGLGIDLQAATTLVAKAAAGHTETLGRYGITVSQAAIDTKGFDATLEAINRQFGGQAAADVDTYAGKVKQVANAWDNVKEAVGKAIVTNPVFVAGLALATKHFKDADTAATGASHAIADFVGFVSHSDYAGAYTAMLFEMVDGYNAVNAAIERTLAEPSPFEKIATDSALPTIREGLRLFNLEVAEHEKVVAAAKKADEDFAKAWEEMAAVGGTVKGAIDSIDGSVVEAIKFYLEAGVAQNTLGAAYRLTATQIKSVATALAEEKDMLALVRGIEKQALADSLREYANWESNVRAAADRVAKSIIDGDEQIRRKQAELADFIHKSVLDSTSYQILKIWEKVDADEAGFKGSEAQRARYNEVVEALATEEAQAVRDLADKTAMATEEAAARSNKANMSVVESWGAIVDAAARAAGVTVVGHRPGEPGSELHSGATGPPITGPGGTLSLSGGGATDPRVLALMAAGFSLNEAIAMLNGSAGHIAPAARAGGGPVVAGTPYMVGERGPELYVPSSNGTIVPNGAGAVSLTIAAGAFQFTYPIMNDPRARLEIVNVLSDALMARLRAAGFRASTGA